MTFTNGKSRVIRIQKIGSELQLLAGCFWVILDCVLDPFSIPSTDASDTMIYGTRINDCLDVYLRGPQWADPGLEQVKAQPHPRKCPKPTRKCEGPLLGGCSIKFTARRLFNKILPTLVLTNHFITMIFLFPCKFKAPAAVVHEEEFFASNSFGHQQNIRKQWTIFPYERCFLKISNIRIARKLLSFNCASYGHTCQTCDVS